MLCCCAAVLSYVGAFGRRCVCAFACLVECGAVVLLWCCGVVLV